MCSSWKLYVIGLSFHGNKLKIIKYCEFSNDCLVNKECENSALTFSFTITNTIQQNNNLS